MQLVRELEQAPGDIVLIVRVDDGVYLSQALAPVQAEHGARAEAIGGDGILVRADAIDALIAALTAARDELRIQEAPRRRRARR